MSMITEQYRHYPARRSTPVEIRFWAFVEKTDGCWNWNGTKTPNGYGAIHGFKNGKRTTLRAHRISHEIHHGPIPDGMDVMHSCDNRLCVNPAHLSYGTRHDNMVDAARKSRICTIGQRNLTHCKHGHAFTEGNIYRNPNGHRRCLQCKRAERIKRTDAIRSRA